MLSWLQDYCLMPLLNVENKPIHCYVFCLSKINCTKNKKIFWKCPSRSAMHAFTFFLCLIQQDEDFMQWLETVYLTRYSRLAWHNWIEICILILIPVNKNEMPGSVRPRLVAPVKEASLHLDCWKDSRRTGASGLKHDVAYVISCIITAILVCY